jgi:hypothetical protein
MGIKVELYNDLSVTRLENRGVVAVGNKLSVTFRIFVSRGIIRNLKFRPSISLIARTSTARTVSMLIICDVSVVVVREKFISEVAVCPADNGR